MLFVFVNLIFFHSRERTSILFQACITATSFKREAVFICHDEFSNIPMFVHNMPKPNADSLSLIKFKLNLNIFEKKFVQ